jgi:hypothetical protein
MLPTETHPPHRDPVVDRLRRVQDAPGQQPPTEAQMHPRANPDRDDYDVERGEEKLSRVLGN